MYDPSRPNGSQSWHMPSPGEILLRIESRLGGLERGQEITFDTLNEGFNRLDRKTDHAHGRITELKGQVEHLQRSASVTTQAAIGATLTSARPSRLHGLTELLRALGAVLPPLGTLAALVTWIVVALTAGVNADMIRLWIGLTK